MPLLIKLQRYYCTLPVNNLIYISVIYKQHIWVLGIQESHPGSSSKCILNLQKKDSTEQDCYALFHSEEAAMEKRSVTFGFQPGTWRLKLFFYPSRKKKNVYDYKILTKRKGLNRQGSMCSCGLYISFSYS